jgi:hypothetical protein
MIFLNVQNYDQVHENIFTVMSEKLPFTFAGDPTHIANRHESGGVIQFSDKRPINHGVTTHTISSFFDQNLDINPEPPIDYCYKITHRRTARRG